MLSGVVRSLSSLSDLFMSFAVGQAEREFSKKTCQGGDLADLEEELCSRLQVMIDDGEILDAVTDDVDHLVKGTTPTPSLSLPRSTPIPWSSNMVPMTNEVHSTPHGNSLHERFFGSRVVPCLCVTRAHLSSHCL